jgi:SAM-dependent methyltransferase
MLRFRRVFTSALLVLAIAGCAELTEVLGPDSREHEPDVVYDPTPPAVVDAMLDLAAVKPGDRLYDLGSGDGRIVIAAAKRYGVHGVGLEVDSALIARANENAAREGVEALVQFRKEDIFTADYHDATVVTLFLGVELNLKLKPRLLTSLAPGTRVVSHEYDMGLWKPEVTRFIRGHRIYLWTVPRRAEAPAVRPSPTEESPAAAH